MKKIVILSSVLFIANMNFAFAYNLGGMDAGAINRQYVRDMRIHEMQSRPHKKSDAIVQPKTSVQKAVIPDVTAEIKSISFTGNNSVPASELNALLKNKINKPMNAQNIADIRKDIMRYYQANGYYSAVPIIVSQDNMSGSLVIQIEEGPKNSIVIE